jgi:hypothetical protein
VSRPAIVGQAGKESRHLLAFTNEDMLEVETLGPLVKLAPGQSVEHVERWELHGNVPECPDEDAIDKQILPRVKK